MINLYLAVQRARAVRLDGMILAGTTRLETPLHTPYLPVLW